MALRFARSTLATAQRMPVPASSPPSSDGSHNAHAPDCASHRPIPKEGESGALPWKGPNERYNHC